MSALLLGGGLGDLVFGFLLPGGWLFSLNQSPFTIGLTKQIIII